MTEASLAEYAPLSAGPADRAECAQTVWSDCCLSRLHPGPLAITRCAPSGSGYLIDRLWIGRRVGDHEIAQWGRAAIT